MAEEEGVEGGELVQCPAAYAPYRVEALTVRDPELQSIRQIRRHIYREQIVLHLERPSPRWAWPRSPRAYTPLRLE